MNSDTTIRIEFSEILNTTLDSQLHEIELAMLIHRTHDNLNPDSHV